MSGYRDAEHQRAAYLARKHRRGGISDTTWYAWRKRWVGIGQPPDWFERSVVRLGWPRVRALIVQAESDRAGLSVAAEFERR